jgi:hypothetical protein
MGTPTVDRLTGWGQPEEASAKLWHRRRSGRSVSLWIRFVGARAACPYRPHSSGVSAPLVACLVAYPEGDCAGGETRQRVVIHADLGTQGGALPAPRRADEIAVWEESGAVGAVHLPKRRSVNRLASGGDL